MKGKGEFRKAVVAEEREFEDGELEWIERCGIENLKGRMAMTDLLAKEAATTLTILLAGAGSAAAYAVKLLSGERSIATFAAGAASFWLGALACCLVGGCLMLKSIPALYNQPGLLLKRRESGETYEEWRRGELENIEERIRRAIRRNGTVARRLNWIRALAALTPFIAGLAAYAGSAAFPSG